MIFLRRGIPPTSPSNQMLEAQKGQISLVRKMGSYDVRKRINKAYINNAESAVNSNRVTTVRRIFQELLVSFCPDFLFFDMLLLPGNPFSQANFKRWLPV